MFRRLLGAAVLAALVLGLAVGSIAARSYADRAPQARPEQPPPPPRIPDPEPVLPEANELVSTFTTRYAPGEPRVVNIRLASRLLDGTVLTPGATFSMNEALGQRTTERGFVPAPTIVGGGGRLIDTVGGGISQVATTLYNAAFFAGLDLVEHQPHSIYIERYPIGREATISWGGPELVFRNDWPAPLRMRLDATDSSLTVRFFSARLGRRVETKTSEPYDRVGTTGFTVDYSRRVYQRDTLRRDERYRWRYEPTSEDVRLNRVGGT